MTLTILSTVNAAYGDIADNWLEGIRRVERLDQVLLVALDEEARDRFSGRGVAVEYRPYDGEGLSSLWIHRVEIIRDLLKQGRDVVHSDLDAVWIGDPIPALVSHQATAVFSQGTYWPPEAHEKLGFVLCCGLFLLKATPEAKAFAEDWVLAVKEHGDDQTALNLMVAKLGGRWVIEDPYTLSYQGRDFTCSRNPMTADMRGMPMAVAPHHQFPRLVGTLDEVLVAHPLSGKTGHETRQVLTDKGLWFRSPATDG